jgi:hypothetical protein
MYTPTQHQIDHDAYPKSLRSKSDESLRYIIADAKEALFLFPENKKAGYYADEINYCAMELARRAA